MRPNGHPRVAATALAALLLGVPATLLAQDTYYVVIGHDDEAREVLLSVHNPTDQAQLFDIVPIASATDGTQRPTPPTSIRVPAGRTMQYSNLASEHPTMIELVTQGELTFQAYTMPVDSSGRRVGLREQIPIVDSQNLVPGGTWAFVSGLRRDSRDRSDYATLNLSHANNTCEHRVRSHDGHWVVESRVLQHRPLSLNYVADVLLAVGIELGDHYTISTRCSDNFYVAGLVADDDGDRLTILQPSVSRGSALRRPGYDDPPPTPDPPADPPPPPPTAACPTGWTCLDLERTRHTVTRSNLQYRLGKRLAPGNYRNVELRFDLRTTSINPVGAQIFWLGISRHLNLIGFTVQRRNELFVRHGIGLKHSDKPRFVLPRPLAPNQNYSFRFSYAAGGQVSLCVTNGSGDERCSREAANVDSLVFTAADQLLLVAGSDGKEEIEPPQWGWTYSNIELRVKQ